MFYRKRRSQFVAAGVVLLLCSIPATSLNNGAARTPPMGWSTFNQWGGNWSDGLLHIIADSLISTGLRDCGYIYVNCDGHNGRDNMKFNDFWPGSSAKFVPWAKPLAAAMHAKGLKFGVYMTTTPDPAQTGRDLAAADVDYLKHDDWGGKPLAFWKSVSDAIKATGRPIVYSTHACADTNVSSMWRTGPDIGPKWEWWIPDFDANYYHLTNAGPDHWPDPDMLEVECRYVNEKYLTYDESRAHFAMWCMMSSPLIIGFDLSRTQPYHAAKTMEEYAGAIAILSNTELIDLDQDTIGGPGRRIKGQGALEVWIKNVKDGTKAVAFFNRTSSAANMSISQTELGWATASQIYVRDLWAHQNLAPFSGTFTKNVATHAAEVYRMSPQPIQPPTETLRKMDRSIAWLARHGHEVFPPRLIPSIIAGANTSATIFDLRGRAIAASLPTTGAAMAVARSNETKWTSTKMVLMK